MRTIHWSALTKHRRWWIILPLIAFAAFFVYGSILTNTPQGREKSAARSAIDTCWESHKRQSLSPTDKRFIASSCEEMEADFSRKFRANP